MGSSKKHKSEREHRHKHRRRSSSRSRTKEPHQNKKRRDKDESKKSSHKHDVSSERKEGPSSGVVVAANNNNNNNSSSNSTNSLSIDEANRLRMKLGMKPLDLGGDTSETGGTKKPEDVHVPAVNLGEMKRTNKLREKMELQREKRKIYNKFSKIKTLGDGDDEDMKKWIAKSRKLEHDREMAEKTAKMLDQMDEDFGIGTLVEEEFNKNKKKKNYSSKDLKGFKVEHNLDSFKEGSTVILTLKDNQVLTEEQDVLVNPRLHEDEIAVKNNEVKKKKAEYTPYDDAEFTDDFRPKKDAMLSKYDEEIYGKKITSFELGSGGLYVPSAERDLERIRKELKLQSQNLIHLSTLAREYYTTEEVETAKFNKPRKIKRKIRKKMLKPDDLLSIPVEASSSNSSGTTTNFGNRKTKEKIEDSSDVIEIVSPKIETEDMDIDQPEPEETAILGHDDNNDIYNSYVVDEDDAMNELYSTLDKVRKLKQKKERTVPDEIAKTLLHTQSLSSNTFEGEIKKSDIILNATSEFCRALGDIPTYGLAGNRDEERDAFLDLELERMERKKKIQDEEDLSSQWNEVDIDTKPVHIVKEESAVLDEEPSINMGLAAALQVAQKKGYLENQGKRTASGPKHSGLEAIHYSIEDKRYDDLDEKYRKRDRYTGMLVDFKEKEGYKPDVRLEYADDSGRLLNEKEAFRQLSHRFHGKGPGKKKTEKRMKKLEEEQLMKQMSSTDTPLNTLTLLQEKQKQERTPYVILSGNKGMSANTIVK